MLRATYAMLMLLPALVVGYAACTTQDSSEENDGVAEAEMTAAPTLLGTFRAEESHFGISLLTLKKDWTFHMEQGLVCIRFPCPHPETNGTYRLTTIDGTRVIALQATVEGRDTFTSLQYLKYVLRGDVLYVATLDRGSQYQALKRSDPAWCSVRTDCDLQDLQPGPCAGNWYCASNACNYTCGPVTCEMENTCPTM